MSLKKDVTFPHEYQRTAIEVCKVQSSKGNTLLLVMGGTTNAQDAKCMARNMEIFVLNNDGLIESKEREMELPHAIAHFGTVIVGTFYFSLVEEMLMITTDNVYKYDPMTKIWIM